MDLPAAAESAERSPAAFLAQHARPLIIDEAQYAPALLTDHPMVIGPHDGEAIWCDRFHMRLDSLPLRLERTDNPTLIDTRNSGLPQARPA